MRARRLPPGLRRPWCRLPTSSLLSAPLHSSARNHPCQKSFLSPRGSSLVNEIDLVLATDGIPPTLMHRLQPRQTPLRCGLQHYSTASPASVTPPQALRRASTPPCTSLSTLTRRAGVACRRLRQRGYLLHGPPPASATLPSFSAHPSLSAWHSLLSICPCCSSLCVLLRSPPSSAGAQLFL